MAGDEVEVLVEGAPWIMLEDTGQYRRAHFHTPYLEYAAPDVTVFFTPRGDTIVGWFFPNTALPWGVELAAQVDTSDNDRGEPWVMQAATRKGLVAYVPDRRLARTVGKQFVYAAPTGSTIVGMYWPVQELFPEGGAVKV